MLIQVLFAIVMLLGITALYADLGLVRLAQLEMQNAADAAALEGLRQPTDADRRTKARAMVLGAFDNSDHNSGMLYSVQFTDNGTGDPHYASAHYDASASAPNQPDPQLNPDNLCHGDLVAGALAFPDFIRAGDPDDCSVAATTEQKEAARAFQVQLRRADERNPQDREDGVSSSGTALPLLFGRLWVNPDANSTYVPRRDGITVRATAVADARPALRVGTLPVGSLPFMANASMSRACWSNIDSTPREVSVVCNLTTLRTAASTVGSEVIVGAGALGAGLLYLPIFDACPSDPLQVNPPTCVIGFGFIFLNGTLVERRTAIAPGNATGILVGGLPPGIPADVLASTQQLARPCSTVMPTDPNPDLCGGLLVPTLAR